MSFGWIANTNRLELLAQNEELQVEQMLDILTNNPLLNLVPPDLTKEVVAVASPNQNVRQAVAVADVKKRNQRRLVRFRRPL